MARNIKARKEDYSQWYLDVISAATQSFDPFPIQSPLGRDEKRRAQVGRAVCPLVPTLNQTFAYLFDVGRVCDEIVPQIVVSPDLTQGTMRDEADRIILVIHQDGQIRRYPVFS